MKTSTGKHFDYIIAGAGAAGLSLLVRMIHAGVSRNQKILLVDKAPKTANDRTWCFWEKEIGLFDAIVFHSWQHLFVHGKGGSRELSIAPYRYKMIRGIDFYNHCMRIIAAEPGISVRYGNVSGVQSTGEQASLAIGDEVLTAQYVFNSILFSEDHLQKDPNSLLQHFKGWNIETSSPVFNPTKATLMDFRVQQPTGAAFVYTMPFTEYTALVEYTLFSKHLLAREAYDAALVQYISEFVTQGTYKITATEYGVIPMTSYRFKPIAGRVVNIGTAGGQTKPSSGYTFQFIQRRTARLVKGLLEDRLDERPSHPAKFDFYDRVLLNVLATGKLSGEEVFTRLFQSNNSIDILRFLDNTSSLPTDISLIRSLPTWPFLRAALKEF